MSEQGWNEDITRYVVRITRPGPDLKPLDVEVSAKHALLHVDLSVALVRAAADALGCEDKVCADGSERKAIVSCVRQELEKRAQQLEDLSRE